MVVTGLGAVTPLGNDLRTTVERLAEGLSGLGPVTPSDETGAWPESEAGRVKQFQARPFFRLPKAIKITDRRTRFAVAAASMALADAGLGDRGGDLEAMGVIAGTGAPDLQPREVARAIGYDPDLRSAGDIGFFSRRILSRLPPLWGLLNLPNLVSGQVAIQLELHGPNSTLMTDWISGLQALGEAFRTVQIGEADCMLAGGAESPLSANTYLAYSQAGLLGDGVDGGRFVVGEGAAFLVLEERERALRRETTIQAEITGYASSTSPVDDATNPLLLSMGRVLEEAGWEPAQIDCICLASVFSRRHFDVEQQALSQLFRGTLKSSCLLEFKTRLGHSLAASGAIDATLSIREVERRRKPTRLLCNCVGFLGQAATLALSVGPEEE